MSVKYPYIRGTKRKYGTRRNGGFWGENGYNCIEAGYLTLTDNEIGIKKIMPLIDCADVIDFKDFFSGQSPEVACDCLGNGYLRLFSRKDGCELRWRDEETPLSSMRLVEIAADSTLSLLESKS